jgi:hypothetical protein
MRRVLYGRILPWNHVCGIFKKTRVTRMKRRIAERGMKMAELTNRQKAARKGVRTRKERLAAQRHYEQVWKPMMDNIDKLLNDFLAAMRGRVNVTWNPRIEPERKLMHGAIHGQLVKSKYGGKVWVVKVFGYKHPREYSAADWTL